MNNNIMNYQMYRAILAMVAEMLRQHGAALGLMAPGYLEQLGRDDGVSVAPDGSLSFWAIVRRRSSKFQSPMQFGLAIQDALDQTCYEYWTDRICLKRLYNLPNNRVGLELVIGAWV